ncbi:hypothetical protein BABINDRAFT_160345 [Babjeviella inositovora NRRL Y-12698]|uniref:Raptor N-terminal CASPase-like domain-containing protein n=1 Tax=Babjeviella inositovora NRRL Y-12698 TaxID=984486 RepID=A0A1E3QVA9_9ASCO|nr:uncharacterized protein BABINDRAFT_160345 [Babjeviella inositovora NRRL Y-12698]ODQ80897.1 hypothetical protein BABINDRAFT_160345 [Babjeviella inositovora NRRL Y-12698]
MNNPPEHVYKPLNSHVRHGLDEDYNSETFMSLLASTFYIYFDDKRHHTNGNPVTEEEVLTNIKNYQPIPDWKVMKERQKTVSAALVLCLNLGVDPPDVMKTHPCAKLESWVDPADFSDTKKAIETIGKNLQSQYETLSLRTRYKQSLDPCVEDMKRFCNTLRRNAKEERILFHYNGHGVPQPTTSGEIWVFNRGYTQYIPISLYDLQTWLGAPCIFVYDCNSAGNIVSNFKKFVQKRIDDDNEGNHDVSAPSPTSAYIDCIQLAACRSNEILPMNPDLPADLFSCCLTCPIEVSIKWFIMQSPLSNNHYAQLLTSLNGNIVIPGKLTDRRTPLGELNWIFTAITDTIAWSLLSRPLFKKLFRQDLMVAALFRNFLLAKRIMPFHNCNPISDPPLPEAVKNHHMWESWDLAIDQVLSQLLKNPAPVAESVGTAVLVVNGNTANGNANGTVGEAAKAIPAEISNYQHSTFFEQHLTAFEMWLKYGSASRTPPEQLPTVLQVLLSQVHRLRALILLSSFLDLGPWAVYLSLSIGISPYVLKLLQSPAQELKPLLVFIWARIMSIDHVNTQQELCRDKGYNYFYLILNTNQVLINDNHKAMSAFILTLFIKDFKNGQRLIFSVELIHNLLLMVEHSENPLLRQWCLLLLSQLWIDYPEGKWIVVKEGLLARLVKSLNDPIPEVRTSIVMALTNFIAVDETKPEIQNQYVKLAISTLGLVGDGSSMVRKEILIFFSKFVAAYLNFFLITAFSQLEEEIVLLDNSTMLPEVRKKSPTYGTVFSSVWKILLILSQDPHSEVKGMAEEVIDYVIFSLKSNADLGAVVREMAGYLLERSSKPAVLDQRTQLSLNGGTKSVSALNGARNINIVVHRPDHRLSSSQSNPNLGDTADNSITGKLFNLLPRMLQTFQLNGETTEKLKFNKILNSSVPAHYGSEYQPKTPRYTPRVLNREPSLLFTSNFFKYSCEYFQEPQMRASELDEPGSDEYIKRLWRRNRNEAIIQETQPQKQLAIRGNWKPSGFLENKTQPGLMKFMQFESYLVSSDVKDNITVWDWEEQTVVSRFSNGNPFGTKITDMKFINEDDSPLLMTGSSDGVVKIYRDFYESEKVELVSAWRALTDILLTSKTTGLISEWQQSRGSLLVSGDVKIIRIWDAPRELCVVDIPARSPSSISSLTSDQVAGNVFVAGFTDGSLRVYDRRLDSRDSMVKLWKPQNTRGFVRNVHMQRGGYRELVSGTSDGSVSLWDIRADEPVTSWEAYPGKTMRCVEVHEHAPIVATASKSLAIWTTSGDMLANLKNPYSYLSNRTSSYLSSIAFHPHRMMLATNYHQDSNVNVYQCSENYREYY